MTMELRNDGIHARRTIYRIAYAYPTSRIADALNDGEGGWYVQAVGHREDGSFYMAPVIDAFASSSQNDPDLLAHLAEWSGSFPRTLEV